MAVVLYVEFEGGTDQTMQLICDRVVSYLNDPTTLLEYKFTPVIPKPAERRPEVSPPDA